MLPLPEYTMFAFVPTSPVVTITCVPPLIAMSRTPGMAGLNGGRNVTIAYDRLNWSPATAVTATRQLLIPTAWANESESAGWRTVISTDRSGSQEAQAPSGIGVTIVARCGRPANVHSERFPVSTQLAAPPS